MLKTSSRPMRSFSLLPTLTSTLSIFLAFCPLVSNRILAQITPDGTLGSEGTIVTPNQTIKDLPADLIQGGAVRGANLFHSFLEFNVNEGQRVYFANPSGVATIFSRVTGTDISDILGTLGVKGGADLFFLNPNGILFGPNAQLDISGSFVGTTAQEAIFADGQRFSAQPDSPAPLLTINGDVYFRFTPESGAIRANGSGHQLGFNGDFSTNRSDRPLGVGVNPGQTLLLLGNGLSLDGANFTAAAGHLELGSVQAGTIAVPLANNEFPLRNWRVNYDGAEALNDILLTNEASVDVSGVGGGFLRLYGRNLQILEDAALLADTLGDQPGQGLELFGTDSITVIDGSPVRFATSLFAAVDPGATGEGGNLLLSTPHLLVADGAIVGVDTFGAGAAGTLRVQASEVELRQADWSVQTFRQATGNAGAIEVTADRFRITQGGQVLARTLGSGNAGNITFQISDLLEVTGERRIFTGNVLSSLLTASVQEGSSGDRGNITINAGTIQMSEGGRISIETDGTNPSNRSGRLTLQASRSIELKGTTSQGIPSSISSSTTALAPGGELVIQTPLLTIQGGAQISAGTLGAGSGGNISIRVEELRLAGNAPAPETIPPNFFRDETLTFFPSGIVTGSRATGAGGDLHIQAQRVHLSDRAQLAVGSTAAGAAGSLAIQAEQIFLEGESGLRGDSGAGLGNIRVTAHQLFLDQSQISTNTAGTDPGGNIELNLTELLALRRGSTIAANATGTEAGGNIDIQTPVLVALENSDITANATNNRGGTQTIRSQLILGTAFRPALTEFSDITASSELGAQLSGTVNILTPELDVSSGLVNLPETAVDPSTLIDRRCDLVGTPNASRFVITGKGGLPPNDRNRLNLTPLWTALDLAPDSTDPGQNSYLAGNYAEAIDSWEAALQSSDLPLEQQVILHANLAQAYATQGDWDSATEAIDRGLNRLNHHSNPNDGLLNRLRARLLTTQSYLLTERGQLNQAFNLSEEAHRLYQEQNDRFGIIQSQLNQAQILTRQGNLSQASDRLRQVQQTFSASVELTEKKTLAAAIDLEWGTVQRLLGNYTTAQTTLERSASLFSQISKNNESIKISAIHHAYALLALGDTERDQLTFQSQSVPLTAPEQRLRVRTRSLIAPSSPTSVNYYQQVREMAPTPNLKFIALTQELLTTIDITAARTRPDGSLVQSLTQNVQVELTQLPLSSTRLYGQLNLAEALLKLQAKDVPSVTLVALEGLLRQTLEEALILGDSRAEVEALGKLGSVYERQQQWSKAQQFTETALSLAQVSGNSDLSYRLAWQLGRLKYAQGNTEGAIVSYKEAIQTLQTLRSDLSTASAEVRFSFRDAVDPIYRETVSLLLSEDTPDTPNAENVIQARDLIESLQLSELVNFFQTDCDVSLLTQIDDLDPHSAVIYPIILSDRLEVIVSLPGQPLQHYATPLPESNLIQGISAIQRGLSDAFSQPYLPLVQQLYDAIIRPVEAHLTNRNIKNLVFVLDGPLRNIPMAVLHDGERFLIERYTIALTPGLQLLDPQPLQQQKLNVLLGGLTEARQGFSALPNVQSEITSISNTIPSNVLINDTFVEQNLTREIESSPFPIVHLATHGEFGSTPEDTFILTWDDRIDVNEFNTILQRRNGNRPIELLILSACRTAAGDDRAALGLAGIAVRSGARSTLASLWYISDEATSVLMGKLYESLSQPNMTKAEAVRQAQLTLLNNPNYANPYYWAPFVLVGNWL